MRHSEWYWLHKKDGRTRAFLCGSPRCTNPDCIKSWQHERIRLISCLVSEYGLDKFFTLTLDRCTQKGTAWQVIPSMWSKMRKRMKRVAKKEGSSFLFVAVLEAHKDGYPHIHGFTNLYMRVERWSSMWLECGGGKVVWLEKVRDIVRVGEYVSKQIEVCKYVGKDNIINAISNVERKDRTLWRSKNMPCSYELLERHLHKQREEGILEGDWVLVKGVENETRSKWQDVERTREAILEQGIETGSENLETCFI